MTEKTGLQYGIPYGILGKMDIPKSKFKLGTS
jgi:hypothetical protein